MIETILKAGGTYDEGVFYPESDGKRMAESDKQFFHIVVTKEGLEEQYINDSNVYVTGDTFWYPIKGQPRINAAPDTMVVFGRPKRQRKSYIQHLENNVAPQIVFEIRSESNDDAEMEAKQQFYEQHGVEEYYMYDPDRGVLEGWLRRNSVLGRIERMHGWISPRMGIRFELVAGKLELYHPDGRRFLSYVEQAQRAEYEYNRAENAENRAEQERLSRAEAENRAEQERLSRAEAENRAAQERAALEALKEKLKSRNINLDDL